MALLIAWKRRWRIEKGLFGDGGAKTRCLARGPLPAEVKRLQDTLKLLKLLSKDTNENIANIILLDISRALNSSALKGK